MYEELEEIVKGFVSGFLNNKSNETVCLPICQPLQGFLSYSGYEVQLVSGKVTQPTSIWSNIWLKLPDETIVDPTASQFVDLEGNKMPSIYIGPKPSWYEEI